MEACGFKRTKPQPRKLADDPQSKMIRALWLQLHEAGKVRNPSEEALAAFVKRQHSVDALQWLSTEKAQKLIEELKKWLAR
jgi:phage gp16-like protein